MEIRKLENYNLEEYIPLRIKMLNENINKQYDNTELEKQTRQYFIENINNKKTQSEQDKNVKFSKSVKTRTQNRTCSIF